MKRKFRTAVVDEDCVLIDEFSSANDFSGIGGLVSKLSETFWTSRNE